MARVLKDWLDGYVELLREKEPPTIYAKWVAISTVASALQRKVWMQWDKILYPNMYVVLVGPPTARKGTAMEPALHIIENVEIKLSSEAVTMQALIREMMQAQDTFPEPVTGTPILHCSLTLFSPELAVLIKRDDTVLINALTDWFDCKNVWRYSTVSRKEERIEKVWVNLLGATTPTLIPGIFPQEVLGGGLASRVIFVYASEKRSTVVFPQWTAEEQELQGYLENDLKEIQSMVGQFTPTDKYLELYESWYRHNEEHPPFDGDELFQYYLGRRSTHLRKLSMIMSAARSSLMQLEEQDLLKAISWFEEAERQMPYVYAGHGKSDHAVLLPRIIAFILKERKVKMGTILRKFMRDANRKDLVELVASLAAQEPPFCFLKQEYAVSGLGTQTVVVWVIYNDQQETKAEPKVWGLT